MDNVKSELGTEDVMAIYQAVVMGEPDPIGSDESKRVYQEIKAEVDSKPNAKWSVPGEIPGVD